MAVIFSHAFTGGTSGDNLTGVTPDVGTAFAKHSSYSSDQMLTGDGFGRHGTFGTANEALYYATDALGSADYYVETVARRRELNGGFKLGIAGRINTAANTFYYAAYDQTDSSLHLFKRVAGTDTELGTAYNFVWFDETDHTIRLTMTGTSLEVHLDGVSRITATDSAISAAGKGGLFSATTSGGPTTPVDLAWNSFEVNGTAASGGSTERQTMARGVARGIARGIR